MKFLGLKGLRSLAGAGVVLFLTVGIGRAGDNDVDLRKLVEEQSKQLEEQKKQLEELRHRLDKAEATKLEAQPVVVPAAVAIHPQVTQGRQARGVCQRPQPLVSDVVLGQVEA